MNTRGLYFEEFEVGKAYKHAVTRTVTETDTLLFTCLTHNTQPLHFDEEFSKGTIHGKRLVNSIFTLGLVTGVSVTDTTLGTTLGNLGFESITFPAPVFIGDTLRSETVILDKRESKSRTDSGVVFFEHRGYNQRGELVCKAKRAGMMMKKPKA